MSSLIYELENNQSLLLMYLSDELPPQDRAEVEQSLVTDPALRGELAEIEAAYAGAMDGLAKLDADRSAEPAENHAVRQACRAMKQWQVEQLSRQPVVVAPPRTRVPVWAYPIGVAAMLVIGALIWWGGQADTPNTLANPGKIALGTNAPTDQTEANDEQAKAKLLENSLNEARAGFSDPKTIAQLNDAETNANSLVARSDSDSEANLIFLNPGKQ